MGGVLDKPITRKSSESGVDCGPLRLTWAASAMQGWRVSMEDAHITLPVVLPRRASSAAPWTQTAVFGVLDGHGGAQVARFSSSRLPEELAKFPLKEGPGKREQMEDAMKGSFHKIDDMLRSGHFAAELLALTNRTAPPGAGPQAMIQPPRNGDAHSAGCTACVCCITDTQIITANAGDSRAVLCSGGVAIPLSKDHKPNDAGEKRRIQAAGGWVESCGAGQHRVNGNLNLSRALGDLEYKKDMSRRPEEQIICSTPDVTFRERDLEKDEFLLICCDGVWDVKTNQQAVDFVRKRLPSADDATEPALEHALEALLDDCVSPDLRETHGLGGDNMTAVVVLLKAPSKARTVAAKPLETRSSKDTELPKVQLISCTAEPGGGAPSEAFAATSGSMKVRLKLPLGIPVSDVFLFLAEDKAAIQVTLQERSEGMPQTWSERFDLQQWLPEASVLRLPGLPAKFTSSSGRLRLILPWTKTVESRTCEP
eukprot:s3114_g11.t1